jgi:hypothetical protein
LKTARPQGRDFFSPRKPKWNLSMEQETMSDASGYLIRSDPAGTFVEAWSAWHLPFEPRLAPQLEYRARLREAIARLGASEGLTATYVCPHVVTGLDVENALFYNVGTPAFRKVATRALRFARISAPPPAPPARLDFDARHYVRYQLVTSETQSPDADPRTAIAKAHIALRDVGQTKNLASLWSAFKAAMIPSAPMESLVGKPFEVRVVISASAQREPCLVEVMKPLLDAFISALHSYHGRHLDAVTDRLSARLSAPPDSVRKLLLDTKAAVLGPRAVPHLRGEGLQWSPADDLLVAGELRLETAEADGPIKIGARVFGASGSVEPD